MSGVAEFSWRRRAAQLGWSATGLALVALAFLALALWLVVTQHGGTSMTVAKLPLGVPEVRLSITMAGLAAAVASYVGLAALQTAAAMRVLSPDRPLPAQQHALVRVGHGDAAALVALPLMPPPEWPATALPTTAAATQSLRCTVLIPAHDEELILARALESLQEQTRTPDRVIVIADNCTDGTTEVARDHGVEVVRDGREPGEEGRGPEPAAEPGPARRRRE